MKKLEKMTLEELDLYEKHKRMYEEIAEEERFLKELGEKTLAGRCFKVNVIDFDGEDVLVDKDLLYFFDGATDKIRYFVNYGNHLIELNCYERLKDLWEIKKEEESKRS